MPSGKTVPGSLFFIWLIWLSVSWVTIIGAKIAVKTQNITMAKPIMPIVESKSLP